MSNITITAIGNVVADVTYFEKSETKKAYTSFRIASTPRHYSRENQEWVDGTTTWLDIKTYGVLAEHVANTLVKGDPVLATGTLSTREWESTDGENRSAPVLTATSVGHNLIFGTSTFTRNSSATLEAVDEAQNPGPAESGKKK
jgi:single-strand DNA-binding protein